MAVVLMPPMFFPISQADMLAYFLHVADAVGLPVMLYNFPELAGNRIELSTIADFAERAPSLGELKRFAQKFGVISLIDKDSRRFTELGLRYAQLSDGRWLDKLSEEPLLLRIPLVRNANQLALGADEATWKGWVGR